MTDRPLNCPKPDSDSCTDQTPCSICPKRWCEWAACNRPMRKITDGWAMCLRHHRDHLAFLAEEQGVQCAGCGEHFRCDDPRRTRCDKCRRVRIDTRPSYAKRQQAA